MLGPALTTGTAARSGSGVALAAFLALLFLTLLIHHPSVRFKLVASVVIALPSPLDEPLELAVQGSSQSVLAPAGGAVYAVDDQGFGCLRWDLPTFRDIDTLRLSGAVTIRGSAPETGLSPHARLLLEQSGEAGVEQREVAQWPADAQGATFDRLFTIRDLYDSTRIDFSVTLMGLVAQVEIHRLSAEGLATRPGIDGFRNLLLCLWIGLVVWVGIGLMRPMTTAGRITSWAVLALLLAGILAPPQALLVISGVVASLLSLESSIGPSSNTMVFAHFGLFAALAGVLFWERADLGWLPLLSLLGVFAGVTELLQLFIEGREPDRDDVLVDLAGVSVAAVLVWAVKRGRRLVSD